MRLIDRAPSIPLKRSVPGTAAIRMLLGEGVPNTDPVWAGIGEFGWYVNKQCVYVCSNESHKKLTGYTMWTSIDPCRGRRGEGLGLGDEEGEGGDGEQEAEQQEQEGADEDEDEVVLVEDRDLDADQTPGEGEVRRVVWGDLCVGLFWVELS